MKPKTFPFFFGRSLNWEVMALTRRAGPGSTKINIDMTGEQVFQLVDLYLFRKLYSLKVKQIIVPAPARRLNLELTHCRSK